MRRNVVGMDRQLKTLQVEFGKCPFRQESHGPGRDPAAALGRIDDIGNLADICLRRFGGASEEHDFTDEVIVSAVGDCKVKRSSGSALRLSKANKALAIG